LAWFKRCANAKAPENLCEGGGFRRPDATASAVGKVPALFRRRQESPWTTKKIIFDLQGNSVLRSSASLHCIGGYGFNKRVISKRHHVPE
jgi:hypothetical protein